ncbi:MAG TPA: translation elongation factor Ts [Acidobacteria bacterium]|nr:translation elongation factor Ts [Acidobacteriota bacterium]MEE2965799.1 translation elongation factor Ts [Acidobacteriota bacterium]HCE01959.1 translation elongation factor Ts [Acidobacteriota bacterium]|tara:strand:+ start:219 stop:821 length:603 start_codon:yes stop_codon:yes gene_type:complete
MAISAAQVKELREKTGVGFMDCKSALAEVDGDLEKAIDILRTRGQARAAKRSGRSTGQGVVGSYIHTGGQVGVLVEVGCESDFVARTDEFQALVREIAMHIAAASPAYGTRAEVPEADVEREKSIFRAQFKDSNKPPVVVDKIVEGKLNSYYQQIVLLDQPSIRDPKTSIGDLVTEAIAKMGENITITRFERFKIGEAPD